MMKLRNQNNYKKNLIQKRHCYQKTNESGKSMMEMLGVLALMGLLSILGAKGYNMAMERAAATKIAAEVNRRSVIYSQQLINGMRVSKLDSSELPEMIEGGYAFDGKVLADGMFSIDVKNVEKEVCRHLVKNLMNTALQISVNGKSYEGNDDICSKNFAPIEYTFSKILTPCEDCLDTVKRCSSKADCGENFECSNGLCTCPVLCGDICCPQGKMCVNGSCSYVQGCTSDDDCDNGICFSDGICGCRDWRDCNEESYCSWNDTTHFTCSGRANIAPGSDTGKGGWMASSIPMRQETAADFCAKYGKSDPSARDVEIANISANNWTKTPSYLKWLGVGNYWIKGTDPWGRGSRALIYVTREGNMTWGSFNLGYFYNTNYALCH